MNEDSYNEAKRQLVEVIRQTQERHRLELEPYFAQLVRLEAFRTPRILVLDPVTKTFRIEMEDE